MTDAADAHAPVELVPTSHEDIDFVLGLERDPANSPFVGQWSRAEHELAISSSDREHFILRSLADDERVGYLIAFDLRDAGYGVYAKRIVIGPKGRGHGRAALRLYLERAFEQLGAPFVWLSVYRENERAQRVYRSLGFELRELSSSERERLHGAVGGFSGRSLLMFRSAERDARS